MANTSVLVHESPLYAGQKLAVRVCQRIGLLVADVVAGLWYPHHLGVSDNGLGSLHVGYPARHEL